MILQILKDCYKDNLMEDLNGRSVKKADQAETIDRFYYGYVGGDLPPFYVGSYFDISEVENWPEDDNMFQAVASNEKKVFGRTRKDAYLKMLDELDDDASELVVDPDPDYVEQICSETEIEPEDSFDNLQADDYEFADPTTGLTDEEIRAAYEESLDEDLDTEDKFTIYARVNDRKEGKDGRVIPVVSFDAENIAQAQMLSDRLVKELNSAKFNIERQQDENNPEIYDPEKKVDIVFYVDKAKELADIIAIDEHFGLADLQKLDSFKAFEEILNDLTK